MGNLVYLYQMEHSGGGKSKWPNSCGWKLALLLAGAQLEL